MRFGRQAETEVESHFFVVEDEAQVQESELDVWRRGVQGATRPATENGTDAMGRGMCGFLSCVCCIRHVFFSSETTSWDCIDSDGNLSLGKFSKQEGL